MHVEIRLVLTQEFYLIQRNNMARLYIRLDIIKLYSIHILYISIQKIRMEIPTKALRTQEREGVPEKRADVAATLHH